MYHTFISSSILCHGMFLPPSQKVQNYKTNKLILRVPKYHTVIHPNTNLIYCSVATETCYFPEDAGGSYRGDVNFTAYGECSPWPTHDESYRYLFVPNQGHCRGFMVTHLPYCPDEIRCGIRTCGKN